MRIAKSSWLRELENIGIGHGVSLLCWRSGSVEHPDTPPYPFTPPTSPTAPPRQHPVERRFEGSAYQARIVFPLYQPEPSVIGPQDDALYRAGEGKATVDGRAL